MVNLYQMPLLQLGFCKTLKTKLTKLLFFSELRKVAVR